LPTLLQEFLAKCPAPKGSQETSLAKGILPATSYLSLPSKLPELKHKEGYQVLSPYYQMTLFDVMYASGRKDDRSISLLDRITLKGVCESSRAAWGLEVPPRNHGILIAKSRASLDCHPFSDNFSDSSLLHCRQLHLTRVAGGLVVAVAVVAMAAAVADLEAGAAAAVAEVDLEGAGVAGAATAVAVATEAGSRFRLSPVILLWW